MIQICTGAGLHPSREGAIHSTMVQVINLIQSHLIHCVSISSLLDVYGLNLLSFELEELTLSSQKKITIIWCHRENHCNLNHLG